MRAGRIVLLLILNLALPMGSAIEENTTFDVTFFDKNADGIDDRMDPLVAKGEDVAVIMMFSTATSDKHVNEIIELGLEVTHVYKYIDAIRIDNVPSEKLRDLTSVIFSLMFLILHVSMPSDSRASKYPFNHK